MPLNRKRAAAILLSAFLIFMGMAIRYSSLNFTSFDMDVYLFWYDALLKGGFSAIREPFAYTPPYLYLIWLATLTSSFLPKLIALKLIPIFFDLCNSFLVYKILKIKYPNGEVSILGACIFFILPTVILNSSVWGQVDSIYTCFLLASIYFLIRNQPLPAVVFQGIALAFKAQAIFLSPLLLLLVLRKRIPWLYLGIIPFIYVLMMVPAMLAGRPLLELMTIYNGQVNTFHFLTLNAPNPYVFISNDLYTSAVLIGVAITAAIASIWVAVYTFKIKEFTPEIIVISGLASAAIIPFFLPKMHDRYFYPADVLSLLAAFYISGAWFLALGFQITSGMVYAIFLLFPQAEPFKETILIAASMINAALIGALFYMQWDLTKTNIPLLENQNMDNQHAAPRWQSFKVNILNQLIKATSLIRPHFLFFLILAVGIFARMWEFRSVPPGVNVDEASIGIESNDLYKFGMDRNGVSYPVHLISWGSGQNVLYAYMLIPFVALNGLTAVSIRLPMLLLGILSLPLIYFVGRKMSNKKFGLIAMFFMAISPWHIINSRWAVESNILPFFLLAGFTLLLFSNQKNHWFIFACVFFSASLYAYGTAYVGVPIFLLLAIPVLIYTKQITIKQAITGLIIFSVIALPIALFVIVNTFQLNTIYLGPVTIPRLPVQARYEAMAAVFGNSPLQMMSENFGIMLKLLWSQEDGLPWNYVSPFGYFYKITFPFALIGLLLTIPLRSNPEKKVERWLLLAWMIASVTIGIIHPTNLTRLNFIFTPLLLCIALFVFELDKRVKYSLAVIVLALSIGFALFTKAYHGEEYRKRAGSVFNSGIIPAIEYATENSKSSVCFTESTYSSYIYVLFTQKMHPSEYINDIEWLYPSDPADPARTPREIGRYHFRLSDCSKDPDAAYILLLKESPPNENINYKSRRFDKFEVYLPKK